MVHDNIAREWLHFAQMDYAFGSHIPSCAKLTQYATITRYPYEAGDELVIEDAQWVSTVCEQIKSYIELHYAGEL